MLVSKYLYTLKIGENRNSTLLNDLNFDPDLESDLELHVKLDPDPKLPVKYDPNPKKNNFESDTLL